MIKGSLLVEITPEITVNLLTKKVLVWERSVFVADTHFGKVRHFRKSGIPIPEKAATENLSFLIEVLQQVNPEKVYFLGDLFHSHYNGEWEELRAIVAAFPSVSFTLIEGNHDILSRYRYDTSGLILKESLQVGPFLLTHHPLSPDEIQEGVINMCGHLHPAVLLRGLGRQSMRLPCFYLSKSQLILPAFGIFTGFKTLEPRDGDRIFIVAGEQIFEK